MGNKKSKENTERKELGEDELHILLKSTTYNKKEITDFYTNFIKLYPTGIVNKEQFFELYKQIFPYKENANEFLELIFKAFDTDGSGNISFEEFLIAISLSSRNEPEQKLRLAFKMYDNNKNGRLESDEINGILSGLDNISEHDESDSDSDIMSWDKDNNGYLTEDEFIKYILSHPVLKKYLLNLIKIHD